MSNENTDDTPEESAGTLKTWADFADCSERADGLRVTTPEPRIWPIYDPKRPRFVAELPNARGFIGGRQSALKAVTFAEAKAEADRRYPRSRWMDNREWKTARRSSFEDLGDFVAVSTTTTRLEGVDE